MEQPTTSLEIVATDEVNNSALQEQHEPTRDTEDEALSIKSDSSTVGTRQHDNVSERDEDNTSTKENLACARGSTVVMAAEPRKPEEQRQIFETEKRYAKKAHHEPEIVSAHEPVIMHCGGRKTSSSTSFKDATVSAQQEEETIEGEDDRHGSSQMSRPGAVAVVGPRLHATTLSYGPVSDDSPPLSVIVAAVPVEEPIIVDAKPMNPRRRRVLVFGLTLIIVLAIAAIILMSIFLTRNPPGPQPLTERQQAIKRILANVSSLNDIEDGYSPQNRSAEWILGDDNTRFDPALNQSRIVQRYVLALLYHSADGEGWSDGSKFLSLDDECDWQPFVNCTISDTVTELHVGECS